MRAHLLSLALLIPMLASSQTLKLASIFGSNMVMQQKAETPVWGVAIPNTRVDIEASWGAKASAMADAQGKWKVNLKTAQAGGPFTLTVKSGAEVVTIKNLLLGEVWVCSGQSNMEMTLAGWPPVDTILNSAKEIANARHSQLRFVTVAREYAVKEQDTFKGSWVECSPETAKELSATAYYFGRKVQNELKVPVGLIVSSWGGTPAEAWVEPSHLSKKGLFTGVVDKYPEAEKQLAAYMSWLRSHPVVTPKMDKPESERWKGLEFGDEQFAKVSYDDSHWKTIVLPQSFEAVTGDFDGIVWLRRSFVVDGSGAGKAAVLSVAKIDDMDRVYVNGVLVGATEEPGAWQVVRKYQIPEGLLKEGINTIAVRVLDNAGGGGIWGDKSLLFAKIGDVTVELSGEWKVLPVAQYMDGKFYHFEGSEFYSRPKLDVVLGPNSPSTLYNGMINPIIPFKIKGAIWYQGESNIGRAEQYTQLFPLVIQSWREEWGQGNFPFYFTQIAPYIYSGKDNNESAYLREAQRRSLATPNTGMAVTLDIGSLQSIHPYNKVDVGERLARLALAEQYGKKVLAYGPLFKSAKFEGGKAVVEFNHAEGLKLTGDPMQEFEVAGEDGVFYPAQASVVGGKVVLSSSKVASPTAARYGFKNGSTSILTNKSGLPASTFTTEKLLK